MASKTDAILLRIGADVSGASKGITDLNKQVGGLTSTVENGAASLVRFAAVAVAGLGLKAAIANALEFGDSMTRMAQQTGMSTDAVQRLDFIASQTGNSVEQITGAIGKMQKTLVESADGGKKLGDSLGYSHDQVVELLGLSPDQQFTEIAKSIAAMTNPAEQTAAAMAAFGKSGAELLPTLKAVGADADALSAQFDAIGGPVSADAIKALDDMGDAGARVSSSVRAFVSELVAMAAPAVLAAMDGVTEFFGGLRVLMGQGSNEAVNLDTEIQNLAGSIKDAEDGLTNFGGGTSSEDLIAMKARLVDLQAQYQVLSDAPMKLAQAQIAARKAAAANGPEELQDIVVHETAKTQTILDADETRKIEQMRREEEFQAKTLEMLQKHQEDLGDVTKTGLDAREVFTMQSYESQSAQVFGELENLTAGVAQHNRAMFNINKVSGIANAIISMHEGVSKSLAAYPMPLAGVMAAIHAAAGLARVQAIASTQFNGGGKGAAPSQAGTPATPTVPAGNGGGGGGSQGGGNVLRVEGLDGASLFTGKFVRGLAEKLAEHQKDGGTVIFS